MNDEKRELFERLLREHGDKVYAFAFSLTHNEPDAAELTADAFRKAFGAFERYDAARRFESWLFRIVQNIHRDAMRRVKSRRTGSLDVEEEDGRPSLDPASPEPAPDAGLERTEERVVLERALARIPEAFRGPLLMCDMLGMPYEEIAKTLDVPLNTVRTRIFRGRKLLREALRPYFEAGGTV